MDWAHSTLKCDQLLTLDAPLLGGCALVGAAAIGAVVEGSFETYDDCYLLRRPGVRECYG